ncbi:Do family serine endopeptidase [bacterium]|nr:Do family serine endopeptidase [bacterium]
MQKRSPLHFGVLILLLGTAIGLIISSSFEIPDQIPNRAQISRIRPKGNLVLGSQENVPKSLLDLQDTSEAFVYVADMVVPTVVSVQTTRLVSKADLEKFHNRDELKDLFRFRVPQDFRQRGSGSGIIVSEDGYILTNVHVVDKAEKLRVLLNDNREFDAYSIGLDPLTEVAVIKVDAEDLPVARLGDSDGIRVGDWVLAVGNPLELRSTVTAGIISAKERQIDIMRDSFSVESFLQTDAAINPGNSGGALVNLRGEVIGVNTAIATETGLSAGFGFAIPINLAKKIMEDLIYKGAVERAYLGIAMININEKRARALSLDRPTGVFIDRVLPDSPADNAGIKPKDVILRIEDEEVNKSNQVQALIAKRAPGDVLALEVLRSSRIMNLEVRLAMRETESLIAESKSNSERVEGFGIVCKDLTRARARDLEYSGRRGVAVVRVFEGSSAAEAGIREGDIILEINDQPMKSEEDFQRASERLESGDVSLVTVLRNTGRGEWQEFHFFLETF